MQREGKDCENLLYITMKRVRQYAPVTTYEFLNDEQRQLSRSFFSHIFNGEPLRPITRSGPADPTAVNSAGLAIDSHLVDHAGSIDNPDLVNPCSAEVPGSPNILGTVKTVGSDNNSDAISPGAINAPGPVTSRPVKIPSPTTIPTANPPSASQEAPASSSQPKYLKEYHTASIIRQAAKAGTYPAEINAIVASHHSDIGNTVAVLKSAKEIESDLKALTAGTTAKRNINKWARTSGFQP